MSRLLSRFLIKNIMRFYRSLCAFAPSFRRKEGLIRPGSHRSDHSSLTTITIITVQSMKFLAQPWSQKSRRDAREITTTEEKTAGSHLKTGTKTSLVVVEVLQKLSISGPVGLIHTLLARDSTAHILLTVRTVQLTHHHPSLAPPRLRKDRSRNSRRDRPIAAFLLSRSLS